MNDYRVTSDMQYDRNGNTPTADFCQTVAVLCGLALAVWAVVAMVL
jgi:hypothetical protein